jgi:hypothetical protein
MKSSKQTLNNKINAEILNNISIKSYPTIKLNEEQFDNFIDICENPPKVSANLKKISKDIDTNGISFKHK